MAQTLQEEKQTDEKLSQLAESELNPAAIQGAQAESSGGGKGAGKRASAS
jgi:hypothetical protein